MIRVLLVADHPMVRQGLRLVLSLQPDMDCGGEAIDGAEPATLGTALRPDVIVVDLKVPAAQSLAAIEAISAALPNTRLVVLAGFDNIESISAAPVAGTLAIIHKDEGTDKLVARIRAVCNTPAQSGT